MPAFLHGAASPVLLLPPTHTKRVLGRGQRGHPKETALNIPNASKTDGSTGPRLDLFSFPRRLGVNVRDILRVMAIRPLQSPAASVTIGAPNTETVPSKDLGGLRSSQKSQELTGGDLLRFGSRCSPVLNHRIGSSGEVS